MAVAVLLFLFCALRTNIVYVLIFACEFVALLLLTGTYFLLANDYEGNEVLARRIEKVSYPQSRVMPIINTIVLIDFFPGGRGLALYSVSRWMV